MATDTTFDAILGGSRSRQAASTTAGVSTPKVIIDATTPVAVSGTVALSGTQTVQGTVNVDTTTPLHTEPAKPGITRAFQAGLVAAVYTANILSSSAKIDRIVISVSLSAIAWVKIYDKATAAAADGSDTPIASFVIGTSGFLNLDMLGLTPDNGLSVRVTALAADNDTSGVTGSVSIAILSRNAA